MVEFTDHDRRRLDEIHSIVTNGLKSEVSRLATEYNEFRKLLDYVGTAAWHSENCPILKERKNRRRSWDWYLTIGVAVCAMASSLGTLIYLIVG